MKKMFTLSMFVLSINAFAGSFVATTYLPTETVSSSAVTSAEDDQKMAALIINDSQEYNQTGKMTAFLAQKIKDIQTQDASVSDVEALDALVSASEQILK